MEKNTYRSLKNDVLRLFASIHRPALEDLYIKMAEAELSPFDESKFYKWIYSNKKIRQMIGDPLVYDALVLLIDLKRRYPKGMRRNEIAREFMINGSPAQSTLISFAKYLSNPEVKSILAPFSNILEASTELIRGIETKDVLADLLLIKNGFNEYLDIGEAKERPIKTIKMPQRENVKQKRTRMFSGLLEKISNDVVKAANNVGLTGLATIVKNGALAQPVQLGTYYNTILFNEIGGKKFSIQQREWNIAIQMTQYVIKNYDLSEINNNYNFIKQKTLESISPSDITKILELYLKKEKDMGKYIDPNFSASIDSGHKIDIQDAQWVDPQTLSILSAFFLVLYGKINR